MHWSSDLIPATPVSVKMAVDDGTLRMSTALTCQAKTLSHTSRRNAPSYENKSQSTAGQFAIDAIRTLSRGHNQTWG